MQLFTLFGRTKPPAAGFEQGKSFPALRCDNVVKQLESWATQLVLELVAMVQWAARLLRQHRLQRHAQPKHVCGFLIWSWKRVVGVHFAIPFWLHRDQVSGPRVEEILRLTLTDISWTGLRDVHHLLEHFPNVIAFRDGSAVEVGKKRLWTSGSGRWPFVWLLAASCCMNPWCWLRQLWLQRSLALEKDGGVCNEKVEVCYVTDTTKLTPYTLHPTHYVPC